MGKGEPTGKRFSDRFYFLIHCVSYIFFIVFVFEFSGEIPRSPQMVCSRCFILFSILFQCNTPLTLTSPSLLPIAIAIGRRDTLVCERFVQKFYFVFVVILMQCALDPHQFPSSSSPVAIRRRNTPPGGFDPDADLQPEGEEEDMHVLQSDAGAEGRGRGRGGPGGRATAAGWSCPGPPA